MNLGRRIESYLKATNTPPTRFGRAVAGDPRLVFDLRNGREPGPKMCDRVNRYLSAREA
jgi:hypothetical protein